jgi:exodeoxyribonuclease-3
MVKIVSWNVNSVRARLQNVIDFISEYQPDIIGLQEIKCINEQFPYDTFEDLGYNCYVHGQKSYNGVAFLSKLSMTDIEMGLPDFNDEQSRYIAGHINLSFENNSKGIEIINCYMPNGNPIGTDKYAYKLAWTRHLVDLIREKLANQQAFILMGDFNIIPTDFDVYDASAWIDDALFSNTVKGLYRELIFMGLVDAIRFYNPTEPCYTFWDYQARAREQNKGIRIDHFLVSPDISDIMKCSYVIDAIRDKPKASDHVPIVIEI